MTRDIVETARAYVPKMKAEGADLIILRSPIPALRPMPARAR